MLPLILFYDLTRFVRVETVLLFLIAKTMRKFLFGAIALTIAVLVWLGNHSPAVSAPSLYQLHEHDHPVATAIARIEPRQPVLAGTVTYGQTADDQPIQGYLARPAAQVHPGPAIIVIHEWWGLNENIETMTRRLAGEGYTALAVDLHLGEVAQTPEQARALIGKVQGDLDGANANIRQAYDYLKTVQQAPKIASLGWCFGGTWSLNTALLFPEDLDAAVIYYGGGITTDRAALRTLQMPIIGFFGAEDTNPPPATVREFERVLRSLGKSVAIHLYEGAGHAFSNPSGTNYVEAAATDAWEKAIAFLATHLDTAHVH